jgi:WW domain-containing oxidoreductase
MTAAFGKHSTATEVLGGIDLTGRTILLTGCNSGIGFETMRVLAGHGAHVIALARNMTTARDACARAGGKTTPLVCDLSDFDSIRRAIADIRAGGWSVDRLIANAGIMMLPRLKQAEGLEKQFVVNYLGHFMLITGILDTIPRHAGARIVIVSSLAHRYAPRAGIELDNLDGARGYSPVGAYGQSNVARILFARALSRRLSTSGITANSLHPGVIGDTNLSRHVHPILQWGIRQFSKTIPQGAATQCYLATHPDIAGITGKYFSDCRIAEPSRVARDDALGERLWAVSERIVAGERDTGCTFPPSPPKRGGGKTGTSPAPL